MAAVEEDNVGVGVDIGIGRQPVQSGEHVLPRCLPVAQHDDVLRREAQAFDQQVVSGCGVIGGEKDLAEIEVVVVDAEDDGEFLARCVADHRSRLVQDLRRLLLQIGRLRRRGLFRALAETHLGDRRSLLLGGYHSGEAKNSDQDRQEDQY